MAAISALLDITPEERKHLIALAESNIHHAVLDTVLTELPEEDKKEFLKKTKPDKENKYQCGECKKYFFKEELTMDHKDPWSKGGRTELSNAELLCRPCNSKKGNKAV